LNGESVARLSFLIVVFLIGIKLFGGLAYSSVALLADGMHSVIDAVTAAVSWIGIKMSKKPADQKFPYGYYRAENVASLIVSAVIVYASVSIFLEGLSDVGTVTAEKYFLIPMGISIVAAFTSLGLSMLQIRTGKKERLSSLKIMGEETRMDSFLSFFVFLSLLLAPSMPWLQGVIAIAISALVFKVGITGGYEAILALMDANPSPTKSEQVKALAKSISGVQCVHSVRLRRMGPFMFAEILLGTQESVDVKKAETLARLVEEHVKKSFPEISSVTVTFKSCPMKAMRIMVPVSKEGGTWITYGHFGGSREFAIVDVSMPEGKIKGMKVMKNPYADVERKRGILTAEWLVKNKVNAVIASELGPSPFHYLKDKFVEIYKTSGKHSVEEVVNALVHGNLERMEERE